ncbi:pyridoxamine 5'-phosphate oxidase family protein [uncultured Methanoregula sp.]|uniref:pyridoxamine 5'-phosphate oxidase family protein n=1 Tax=uncultured Methanoregula sp. TaxID=1005933 RepID=UPI002AAAB709|nr:pyridoxamine 5'-phosphate oxidase family protein [uncultured Methanoregula sp.]
MRRKDREITDPAGMAAILDSAPVCRLGLADGNEPYVVPLCFGRDGSSIYIHSSPEGKKIAIIRHNPCCCVEVDNTTGPVPSDNPCSWEMQYQSVICTGTAHFVTRDAEKQHALTCILKHYGGEEHTFSEKELGRVCVIRIDIREMTGKKHGC